MLSIKEKKEIEYSIRKSKFIGKIFPVYTKEEVEEILKKEREKYRDATHICYAYILENTSKVSDDGEPSGTAGIPILNVLQKNNLYFTLCMVIRYFGGIKLGAGGLIRAYGKGVKEVLSISEIVFLKKGKKIKIEFDYNFVKKIDTLLKDAEIINKDFKEKITYEIRIEDELYQYIKVPLEKIVENTQIIENIFIKENKS